MIRLPKLPSTGIVSPDRMPCLATSSQKSRPLEPRGLPQVSQDQRKGSMRRLASLITGSTR
ncbi:hypothetical protein REJC140_03503 [Pseudorhizobium endolithicum]|uniref:Uncharacterized protein n=1 Tax=Pseudorhizobium endolithicum TaxID=1191678 RepID=A0ABN7JKW8_9HYPH|nr:hypothetical protein [Pseudorhizobium endolithicum]CAD7036185.1 hypothetical protein REJC140_03503 [Pseudorhizobium endolithicum]